MSEKTDPAVPTGERKPPRRATQSQRSKTSGRSGDAPPFDVPELIPVRMLNEFTYCPRLSYLEWVQGEFADNYFTEHGRYSHRRVDSEEGKLSPPDENEAPRVARSVSLSAPREGLVARVDLVETEGASAVPVDYKRGSKPDVAEGAYEPERVQLCAQGLILRENGYACDRGIIYFVRSKERVEIPFDEGLVSRTRALIESMRAMAASGRIPEPLDDSPKCDGCSLVGICLPDEIRLLEAKVTSDAAEPRRLLPARDDALPLYVQTNGAFLGKSGDRLVVKKKKEQIAEARLFETSHVALFGSVQVSTAVLREACQREMPITFFSSGGWFYGMTQGLGHKNVELRIRQHEAASDTEFALSLARRFVEAKIRNCRTLLRRNGDGLGSNALKRLSELGKQASEASSVESLLGVEGTAARVYFENFTCMLKQRHLEANFGFEGRNRRPPTDPINAMLSLAYALLTKDLTVTAAAVGFDPYRGFFHKPRYGRPSIALDLMEEFRPIIADSTVLSVLNNGMLGNSDFIRTGVGVSLKADARKAFIAAYERRMDQLVRHPVFKYQISYRRVLEVQTRLLARHLAGEIPEYPQFITR